MTRQEIIEGLRGIHAVALDERQLYINDMSMQRFNALLREAAELLEKQRPVTVKPDYNFDTGGRYGRCPVCKSLIRRQGVYCWSCGQMLRWEG